MENINLSNSEYKVIKKLESDDKIYYYTLDVNNDNEVVILCESIIDNEKKFVRVDEREYSVLMNKFALE